MAIKNQPSGVFPLALKSIRNHIHQQKSFDDAAAQGLARASEIISDLQGAWIQDQKVVVNKGKITEYCVSMKITFLLADKKK